MTTIKLRKTFNNLHKKRPIMPEQPLIEFSKICKHFGKHLILNNLDMTIGYKEIFGIVGLSGSGKTTLLNILIGFVEPSKGKISFQGKDIIKNYKDSVKKLFGFVTQSGSFYTNLTVEENLSYFGRLYDIPKRTIYPWVGELLALVELEDARHILAEHLSTGMQRRLDIACALIHKPTVLVLDEPTADLDPVLRKEVLSLIQRIRDNGTTVVITSHLLSEHEGICNKIAILHEKQIIRVGSPVALKEAYTTNEEITFSSTPGDYKKVIAELPKSKINNTIIESNKAVIYTPAPQEMLQCLTKALLKNDEHLLEVSVAKPSLEEVFESLTRRKGNA